MASPPDPSASSSTVATPPITSGTGSLSVPAPVVSTVSAPIKLPPFWPADPELWFVQVEAQFACRKITSQKSKFDHVVSSLAPEYAAEVRDLLISPPTDNPYTTLRTQLIKRTTASDQRKLQLLLTSEELGDRKPSQLLRRIQQLLGNRPGMSDESFLKELFMQRLPPNVRMVLASTPEGTEVGKLADLADKVMEAASPTGAIASVTPPPTKTDKVEHLQEEVSRLEKLVQKLSRPRSPLRPTLRPPSRRSPTPPINTSADADSHSLCWYHRTFGSRARQCRPPCAWQPNP